MATLNLGRIKPVFRGAYADGTAYVVDDIVTSGGETFICIQASTGNATSNATYWTKLAEKGLDGTNVATTLTTQGDILYRDGSGLQRLPKGTANQVLKMNSGATAPEYGDVSAEIVKLAEVTTSSNATVIDFNGYFDDTTYYSYVMRASVVGLSGNQQCKGRYLTASNTEFSGQHSWATDYMYRHSNSNTGGSGGANFGNNYSDHTRFSDWAQKDGRTFELEWQFTNPQSTSQYKCARQYCSNTNDGDSYFVSGNWISSEARTNTAFTGIRIYLNGGYYLDGSVFKLYGWKK